MHVNNYGHTKMQKSAYTINETIQEIGIGRTKLYQLIKAGELTPRKIGKKTIILSDDLQEFLRNLPEAA